jgi:hypothetical protein
MPGLRVDPLIEFARCSVVEADETHAVVRQPPASELENHLGARHAGALFTVGYAASRALVAAALGADAESVNAKMTNGEVVYEKVVAGEAVAATAEPAGDDWPAGLARIAEGEPATLQTAVTVRNERDRTVMVMSVGWEVSAAAGDAR